MAGWCILFFFVKRDKDSIRNRKERARDWHGPMMRCMPGPKGELDGTSEACDVVGVSAGGTVSFRECHLSSS